MDHTNEPRFLIVSYSYSGHTHRVAEALQQITGGDWCEIYPWQPYPAAFPELLSQARKEIQGHVRPRLLPVSIPPRPYPVIFVGTPPGAAPWRHLWPSGCIITTCPGSGSCLLRPLRRRPLRFAAGHPDPLSQGGGGGALGHPRPGDGRGGGANSTVAAPGGAYRALRK